MTKSINVFESAAALNLSRVVPLAMRSRCEKSYLIIDLVNQLASSGFAIEMKVKNGPVFTVKSMEAYPDGRTDAPRFRAYLSQDKGVTNYYAILSLDKIEKINSSATGPRYGTTIGSCTILRTDSGGFNISLSLGNPWDIKREDIVNAFDPENDLGIDDTWSGLCSLFMENIQNNHCRTVLANPSSTTRTSVCITERGIDLALSHLHHYERPQTQFSIGLDAPVLMTVEETPERAIVSFKAMDDIFRTWSLTNVLY